jgi:glycosyltransferase involved in cell wall biosynthesis
MNNANKKLQVVTFIPLPPLITGGIEEYAYSVVKELRDLGLDVTIVTSRIKVTDYNSNNKYLSECNKYIYVTSVMFLKRPIPINILSLFRIFRAIIQSDVIHIHMPYPFLESFAAIVAKLASKKLVVTYHADAKIDIQHRHEIKNLLFSIIERLYVLISARWPLIYSDVICTNTMAYAQNSSILRRYIKKVKVVYQGIRKDLYELFDNHSAQIIRKKYLGQKYSYLVTFVGRLVPYKGLEYLIEAIHLIGMERKIICVIGGDGPQKEYLIDLVERYDLDNIIFIGFVKNEDLFNLLAGSDVVVAPSISELESTPITLLSALAVGTPVIGTSIGGTAETIPNDGVNGIIIPPKDSRALAEAIIKITDNSKYELRKIMFKPRFWSDVAKDYADLFDKLCNKW